jgi:hypothetical protein
VLLGVSDDLFPSGPWTGFYNYEPPKKHRMDLHLTFTDGSITGDGSDDIGRFLIAGRFDSVERECRWTKTYPGSHDVHYRGFRDGKGIWGTWEIGAGLWGHGGFHIWPKATGETQGQSETVGQTILADAIGPDQC